MENKITPLCVVVILIAVWYFQIRPSSESYAVEDDRGIGSICNGRPSNFQKDSPVTEGSPCYCNSDCSAPGKWRCRPSGGGVGKCENDYIMCETDSDCKSGLKCKQREDTKACTATSCTVM